jgi:predicted dithiol-disulfide oxidoreductase (DUF899 family)
MSHPAIASREEWLKARKALLVEEKAFTRQRDALNAARRRLPMVKIDKDYVFDTPQCRKRLIDLFEGRSQLIVYHFMFDPRDPPSGKAGEPFEEGCSGCSFILDNVGHLAHLNARDTTFVAISRAPLSKIAPFKARMGWTAPWVSSFGSDFNYDFHATTDEKVAPVEYNYCSREELAAKGETYHVDGEQHGVSVFLRIGDEVFHTYSTYGRGVDMLMTTFNYLDLTPYGRREEWEDSPEGWPQSSTHGWLRHHDKYDAETLAGACCDSTKPE